MSKEQSQLRYKFLRLKDGEIKSARGNMTWEPGEWAKVPGKIAVCSQGLHCSVRMLDALSYVRGEIVARVEVYGTYERQNDKEAWQEMRLVDVRLWRKEDSVALAIYAAELVIDIFESRRPGDDRPRKAIEAAKKWLKDPTSKNAAAYAAAYAAADAAAYAADAADAAAAAADAAAYADAAAKRAGRFDNVADKVNAWMESHFDSLPKYGKEVTPDHIEELESNQIIVVGTNTAGMHGGGLARQAAESFGLEAGIGEGLSGHTCYAFPTLSGDFEKRSTAQLRRSVSQFYATVKALPEKQFLLTKVGTGIAGYGEEFMKELFKEDVSNLIKPENW